MTRFEVIFRVCTKPGFGLYTEIGGILYCTSKIYALEKLLYSATWYLKFEYYFNVTLHLRNFVIINYVLITVMHILCVGRIALSV
jgi:hypothetical protein